MYHVHLVVSNIIVYITTMWYAGGGSDGFPLGEAVPTTKPVLRP